MLDEEAETMEEKKPIEESLENLEKASGGANFGTDNADEICFCDRQYISGFCSDRFTEMAMPKMRLMECRQL